MITDHQIVIALAQKHDLPAIHRVFTDSISQVSARDYTAEQIAVWLESARDHDRWYRKLEQQYFIVAKVEGDIAGFASLENNNYVDLMYVHPQHMRKGIGAMLLAMLEEVARSKDATSLIADVSITAVNFFERMGFTIMRRNSRSIKGVELINYTMTKTICDEA